MKINVINLGTLDYLQALKIQEELRELRANDKIEDTLLIVEHPAVLTLGVKGKVENILVSEEFLQSKGVDVVRLNRGGDVTYHGPGQIVGYPIFHLKNYNRDVRKFVWRIKETFIKILREIYNIESYGLDGEHTGVWIGNDKITAIGISISKMVSMHGFAFNVNTNLEHFSWIYPCGFKDRGTISLEKLVGHPMDMDKLKEETIKYFCELFEVKPVFMRLEDVLKRS